MAAIYPHHRWSWSETLAQCQRPLNPCHIKPSSHEISDSRTKWTGTATWNDAIALAAGDINLAARIQEYAAENIRTYASRVEREDLVWQEQGFCFDVSRVLEGVPEAWLSWEQQSHRSPRYVEFISASMASGTIPADNIYRRGAGICAAIRLFEKAGYRARVVSRTVVTSSTRGTRMIIDTEVKGYRQPLDMPRLAFALAHPSYLRRLMFAVMEQSTDEAIISCIRGGSYGRVADPEIPGERRSENIVLPSMRGDIYAPWDTNDHARQWLLDMLRQHGVTLKGQTP